MSETPPPSDLPYRPCVGMMLLNREGYVFAGQRIDQTAEAWQMPQGGIDAGETPHDAVLRELEEEIGTRNVTVLREHPDWLTYDLPPHLVGRVLHGRFRGQRQKWFALRFQGEDKEINLATGEPEFAAWKWVAMDELLGLIVPFKRALYAQIIAAFADLTRPAA
jgi:putative (di)nucleoside polyphosphate hydrolase